MKDDEWSSWWLHGVSIKFARHVDIGSVCVDIRPSPKSDVLVYLFVMFGGCWKAKQSCVVKINTGLLNVGSDDAKAPNFPAEVLGSRAEAPPGAIGIYSRRRVHNPITDMGLFNQQLSSVSLVSCWMFWLMIMSLHLLLKIFCLQQVSITVCSMPVLLITCLHVYDYQLHFIAFKNSCTIRTIRIHTSADTILWKFV